MSRSRTHRALAKFKNTLLWYRVQELEDGIVGGPIMSLRKLSGKIYTLVHKKICNPEPSRHFAAFSGMVSVGLNEYSRRKYSELLVLLLRIENYENSRLNSSSCIKEQYKSRLNTTISKNVAH